MVQSLQSKALFNFIGCNSNESLYTDTPPVEWNQRQQYLEKKFQTFMIICKYQILASALPFDLSFQM